MAGVFNSGCCCSHNRQCCWCVCSNNSIKPQVTKSSVNKSFQTSLWSIRLRKHILRIFHLIINKWWCNILSNRVHRKLIGKLSFFYMQNQDYIFYFILPLEYITQHLNHCPRVLFILFTIHFRCLHLFYQHTDF